MTAPAPPSSSRDDHATPRDAARHLRERFRAEGLRAAKQLGQHFLADLNLARKVVSLLPEPTAGPVLEIGPGLGALTGILVESGYRVVAVEVDPRLAGWLREAFEPWSQVEVMEYDVRTLDIARLARELTSSQDITEDSGDSGQRLQIIGNLPYYATTDILLQILAARETLGDAVLTLQREVADRLAAGPGSRTYGSLSASFGLRAKVESSLRLPATAFWPAPDVDSATIRVRWLEPTDGQPEVPDALLEQVIRAAFAQRRKQIENSLAAALGLERAAVEAAVAQAGIDAGMRAEALAPADFARLALAMAPWLTAQRDEARGGDQ